MTANKSSEVMSTRSDFSSSRGMVHRAPEISDYKSVSSTNKYKLFDDKTKRRLTGSVNGESAVQLWQAKLFAQEVKEDVLDNAGIDIVDVKMENKTCFRKRGIMDPRMGPIVPKVICETCHQELGCCPGHMGRIELASPFIMHDGNAGVLSKALIHALKCVCIHCSDLLNSPNAPCEQCMNGQKQRKIKSVSLLTNKPVSVVSGIKIDVKSKGRSVVVGAMIRYENEALFEGCNVYAPQIRDVFTAIEHKYSADKIKEVMGALTQPSCLCPQVLLVLPPVHRPDKSRAIESSNKRTVGGCTTSYQNVLRQNAQTWYAYLKWKYMQAGDPDVREEFYRRHNLSMPAPIDDNADGFRAILENIRSIYVTTHENALRDKSYEEAKDDKSEQIKTLKSKFETESGELAEMINRLFNGMETTSRHDEHAELADFSGLWNIIDGRQSGGGKEGLPRKSALGKRTGFIARGVILPNSHLSHTQVGMPRSFMRTLSLETGVGTYNLNEIMDEIRNPSEKDGRYTEIRIVVNTYTQYRGNFKWKFDSINEDERSRLIGMLSRYKRGLFKQGSFVGRRLLRDGDVAMVNRQPTLQRQNMQALRIVGVDGDCLIMNPEQAKAYNLDFDGDQMNVFVPQDEMARAELAVLHSPAALVATANGTSILGPGPSTVLGLFVLTDPKYKMDRRESIKLFSEIFATLRETNFNILNDKSYYIDRGSWMQTPANYDTRYTTALDEIARSDNPWQHSVRELISLCLPHGFDAIVYGKKFDKYTGEGKRYKVASGADPIPLVDAWQLMFSNGAKYMVASVDVDGNLVGVYIESTDVNTTVGRWRGFEPLDDGEIIPRGAKTVAFGVPMAENTQQTLPVLRIDNGRVNDELPQLTGEMLKTLYNQVLHFAGGAGVIAAMESFQHIAHATMARLEMTASSPGDLFNAISNRSENSVDKELLNMATKEYVSTKGELITQLDEHLHNLCMQVKNDQTIFPDQHDVFLKLDEPAQMYVLNVIKPDNVVKATQWITSEDNKSTVIARALSNNMHKVEIIRILERLKDNVSLYWQVVTKFLQTTKSRTLKAEIWHQFGKSEDDVLHVLDRMNTAEKAKALIGLPRDQIESILSVISNREVPLAQERQEADRTYGTERAEITEAIRDVHKKMLPACQDAISDSIIPLDIWDSYNVDPRDHMLAQARLVPMNSLDTAVYHSIDNTNASLESLITGGTAACVQAGAQFPKGSAKDLRNMGVAIGHLKKTGMPSVETINKSGKEAPTLRDWGFVADNYITGIRYFPNFLQSQQLGIRSELEGKQDVGKVGYSARQLLLAHICVVAGMYGEARYLAGKGQERIIQFIYGSDGQDPHKLIPLAGSIDYNGSMALAMSWGTTSIPYPSKDTDTPIKDYLKKQCKYLLYGKSINSKMLNMACSIIGNKPLHSLVTVDDIEQICSGVTNVLRFTSPEDHTEIGRKCQDMLLTRQDMQLGQLFAFAFDIVSRSENSQNVRCSVNLHSAMTIARRWGTEECPYPDQITKDSPLWVMCPLIRSNALVGLLDGKRFTELETNNTTIEEVGAIYDSMKTYWSNQCALTPTISNQLQDWMDVNLRFATKTCIYSLYMANMLLEAIQCPLNKEGSLDEELLSKVLQSVSIQMLRIEFSEVFSKHCLLKCCGDILSGNKKNDTLLENICHDNSATVHEVLSVNLDSSHSDMINAIIAGLHATLSRLPSRHTGLFQECKKMIEENIPMQLGQLLAFVCIVVNRLEYSRIEYGAPIGGWAVEALMSDIQQAALDAKHRIGNQASAKDRFKELVEFPYPNDPVVTFENSARFDKEYFEDNKFSAEMVAYSLFYIHGRADRSIEERDWWGGNEVQTAAMIRCNISEAGDAQFSRGVGVCIEFSTEAAAVEFCSKHLNLPSHKALKHDKRKVWQLSMGAKLRTIEDAHGIESRRLVQVACTAAEAPLHRVVRELVKNRAASLEKQIETSVEWMRRWGAIGDDAIRFLASILLQVTIQYPGLDLLNWWELLKQKVVPITSALHNDVVRILRNVTEDRVFDVLRKYTGDSRIRMLENMLGEQYYNPDIVRYLVSVLIHVYAENSSHTSWIEAVEIRIYSVAKFKEEVWVQLFKDPIDMQDFVQLLVPKFEHLLSVEELRTPSDNVALEEAKLNVALVQKYEKNIAKDKHACENEPFCTLLQDSRQVRLSREPQTVEEELLNDTLSVQRDMTGTVVEYNQCTHGDLNTAPRELAQTKYEWYYATGYMENSMLLTEMIENALASDSKPNDKTLLETCMNKLNNDVMLALKQTYGTGITDVVQAYQDKEDVLRNVWCLRFDMNDSAGKATSTLGQTDAERYKERLLEREKRTRESPLLSIAHKLFTNKTEILGDRSTLSEGDFEDIERICNDAIANHSSYEEIMELMRHSVPSVEKVEAYRDEAKRIIDSRAEEMEEYYILEGKGCPYPTSSSMSLTLDVDKPPIVQATCGIEIARLVMRQELDKLFAKSDADPRHAQILADTLSIDGFLRGIRRSDVAEVRTPLELSAYERIQNALNEAAIKEMECDEDTVHVAAMYNRPPQLGTGLIGSDLRHLPQCHNLMSVVTQMSAYVEPPSNSTAADDAMDVDSGTLGRNDEDSDNDMLEML